MGVAVRRALGGEPPRRGAYGLDARRERVLGDGRVRGVGLGQDVDVVGKALGPNYSRI